MIQSRGQTNVTGSLMLVGISVILATVAATYLSGFAAEITAPSEGSVQMEEESDGSITVTLEDKSRTEKVIIRGSDGTTYTLDTVGESKTVPPDTASYSIVGVRENGKETLLNTVDIPNTTPNTAIKTITYTPSPSPTPTATPSSVGDIIWSESDGGEFMAVSGDKLIPVSGTNVTVFNKSDGSTVWNRTYSGWSNDAYEVDSGEGRIFITNYADTTNGEGSLKALDLSTGNQLWSAGSSQLYWTVRYHDSDVYVSSSSQVASFTVDGSSEWTHSPLGGVDPQSLAIGENRVYVEDDSSDCNMIALKQSDSLGALESRDDWTRDESECVQPEEGTIRNSGVYALSGPFKNNLSFYDNATNTKEWTVEISLTPAKMTATSDTVYLGDDVDPTVVTVDASTGTKLWNATASPDAGDSVQTLTYAGDRVYVGTDDFGSDEGYIRSFYANNGTMAWEISGHRASEMTVIDGVLYVTDPVDGTLAIQTAHSGSSTEASNCGGTQGMSQHGCLKD